MENGEQKTCQVIMHEGKPCGRPLYDGEKCVCHSERKDKDMKAFQQELDRVFEDEQIKYYDFTGFVFPKEGWILPRPYWKDVHFSLATFSGEADFSGARFEGKVHFWSTWFAEKANFHMALFSRDAAFVLAKFSGEASFWESTFSANANFRSASFSEHVYFWRARFSGQASFMEARFSGRTNFISTQFLQGVDFSHCEVQEGSVVVFDGEQLRGSMRDTFPAGAYFRSCSFAHGSSVTFRKLSLDRCRFLETDLRGVQFVDVCWAKKPKFFRWLPRNTVYDEFDVMPNYNLIAQLYRRLQENYISNYRFSEAGDFFVGEQEMIRKSRGKVGRFFNLNLLNKAVSYYGESFLLPLAWIVYLFFFFPLVMLFGGVKSTVFDAPGMETHIINYDLSWSPADCLLFTGDYWNVFWLNIAYITSSQPDLQDVFPMPYQWSLLTMERLLIIILVGFFLFALNRGSKQRSYEGLMNPLSDALRFLLPGR